jgi:hypothetical protein
VATTTKYIGNYNYLFEFNKLDTDGDPQRALKVNVYTIDIYDNLSDTCATDVFTNPAPDMSAVEPDLQEGPTYIQVSWNHPSDLDLSKYIIKMDKTSPPSTIVASVAYPENHKEIFGLEYGSTYYFQVVPYDLFGVGEGTLVVNGQPNQIPQESVDIELQASIVITDEDETEDLTSLYDGVIDSGGVVYSGGWKWIEYDLGVENFINGVQLWIASNTNVCVAISTDGTSWEYFSGKVDHTLNYDNSQYRLVSRADLNTAQTNYWTASAGYNYAFLPNGIIARRCRLYLNATSSKTIYELVFRRIVIAEDIAVERLSGISADIGNITAGALQSSDYSETTGVKIDLDNSYIRGKILFYSNSSGYSNLTDKPTTLAGINSTEGSKLSGIASGATNNSSWSHPNNTSLIDGGKMSAGSSIVLNAGGFARFGQNVLIDTNSNTGSIIVSKTAPIEGGKLNYSAVDYAHLTDGDLKIFYYNGTGHTLYNSLTRIETGTAVNGSTVVIPGIWRNAPKVSVFPNSMTVFKASHNNQDQKLICSATSLVKHANFSTKSQYQFVPKATLEIANNTLDYTPNIVKTANTALATYTAWHQPDPFVITNNTRRVIVTGSCLAYAARRNVYDYIPFGSKSDPTHYEIDERKANAASWYMYLYYLVDNVWYNKRITITKAVDASPSAFVDFSIDTGTTTSNIQQITIRQEIISARDIQWISNCASRTTSLVKRVGYTIPSPNPANWTYQTINFKTYQVHLVGTTVLATGSLSWLAIGA